MFSAVAVFALNVTSNGSCRYLAVILRIAGGMVAENSATCLYSGVSDRMRSTSSAEAHGEHLVGLVEHQVVHPRQVQGPAFEVVDDPARGADHHLRTAFQPGKLHSVGGPAVDRQHVDLRQMGSVAAERLGHLQSQLTRRGQHERLSCLAGDVDFGQDRYREGRRLAGARLRQSHHVGTRHQRWNRRRLDGRRRLVADVGDRPQDRRVNLQVGKRRRRRHRRIIQRGHLTSQSTMPDR